MIFFNINKKDNQILMLQIEKLEKQKEGLGHKQVLCWHMESKEVIFIRLSRRLQSFACVEHGSFLIGRISGRLSISKGKGLKFPIANGINQ